jgi:hypothetical protein
VGISLETVKLDFIVEGRELVSTKTPELSVPAKKTGTTTFYATLKYADIIGFVADYAQKDSLAAVIKTQLVLPLPAIAGLPPSLTFSYDFERRLPTVKPRISIANFRVKQPSSAEIAEALKAAGKAAAQSTVESAFRSLLSGSPIAAPQVSLADIDVPLTVSFDIVLVNETAARLVFTDLGYDFTVNGQPLIKGLTKDIATDGSRSVLNVENRFSSRSLGVALFQAFQSGQGEFSLTGQTALQFPEDIRKTPVPLKFTEEGAFNLR